MGEHVDRSVAAPAAEITDQANVARMYDYLLGGGYNFAADRAAAERAVAQMPDLPAVLRANRDFLRRVVTDLARRGIRQFLDLGAGIPTVGNVHEVAHRAAPDSQVVYVDVDPIAVIIADQLLASRPHATTLAADLRHPEQILAHPRVRDRLDLTRPVAVLLIAVLHLIPDTDDPAAVLHTLYQCLPAGSFLALSHMSPPERQTPAGMRDAADTYARSGNPLHPRTLSQIEALLGDWQLLPPGLVACPLWQPDPGTPPVDATATFPGYAGLAHKPAPPPIPTLRPAGTPSTAAGRDAGP